MIVKFSSSMIELVVRFQWVKCQLDALGRCLSLSSLRKALRSLPKDLDDTYARILQSIEDDEHSKLVAMIMQWLAYSQRPMTLTEISAALTVDPYDDHPFDMERRLEDPQDLLRICSSLVTTVLVPRRQKRRHPSGSGEMLQFAHFSVREYLESSRTHDGPAKRYAIQGIRSNTFIAESCIIYLLHLEVSQTRTDTDYYESLCEEYPLVEYAAFYWIDHAQRAGEDGNIIALGKTFPVSKFQRLDKRLAFCHSRRDWCFDAQGKHLPLLYALSLNVPKITSALILEGADVNACNKGGWTPLMQISTGRDKDIELVQLLLKYGADVNALSQNGETALKLAAWNGQLQLVRILLDSGADMDERSQGDAPLIYASRNGQFKAVQLLLDRGASITNSIGVTALHCASVYGDPKTVEMLLQRGIDVDAELYDPKAIEILLLRGVRDAPELYDPEISENGIRSDIFTTALLRSLQYERKEVVNMLLKHGADVNARSTVKGLRGIALEHALNHGRDSVVHSLLEHGADSSLVKPEHLNEKGMRRYKEMFLKKEGQNRYMGVQEEETEEVLADT